MKDLTTGYDIPDPPPIIDVDAVDDADTNAAAIGMGFPISAKTAFTVILTNDGRWIGISTLVDGSLPDLSFMSLDREAGIDDMAHAGSLIAMDASNQLVIGYTAQQVMGALQQNAQQAQAAQRNAMENARVMEGLKGNKLKVPGR